jgi:hypothetical protein
VPPAVAALEAVTADARRDRRIAMAGWMLNLRNGAPAAIIADR